MKIKKLNVKMLGIGFAATALVLASCSEDKMTEGDSPNSPGTSTESTIYTAALKAVASSADRVVTTSATRADEGKTGSLRLLATIENPSKQDDFANFEKEDRYLSATCVYYDKNTGTYYATYHMQGNNYSTVQEVETAGLIETFTVAENGTPSLGQIYRSANPATLDFDFNHLYFDVLNNDYLTYNGSDAGSTRIVAVGHKSEPSSKVDGKPNTAAIIATLNLEGQPSIDYSVVYTGEKILDANGKSLGRENAGDVNCVIRKSNYYYLATRKGIAVLNAKKENLFTPIYNIGEDGYPIENSIYFIKTPGSTKHVEHIYTDSHFSCLYLTEKTPESGIDKTTASSANIIKFSMETGYGTVCASDTSAGVSAIRNTSGFDITTWSLDVNQSTIPEDITPVDGKNVLALAGNGTLVAACLGRGGLYIKNNDSYFNDVITFSDKIEGGSRPVNGVFAEPIEYYEGGRATNGFLYVANGACLTILDANTLKVVAEYSAFEEGKQISANYVNVVKTDVSTNVSSPDRIITVAYGQAGVKVFKFIPPTKK